MCTIMLLLRGNSSRPFLTSLVPAYYTLNHSVTFIWLVATTTHPSFLKHVRVTASKGHSNSRETKEADVRFQKFTLDPQKSRQNGENVNPFGAMASVAGDQSGPWTGWIGPAPV